jgi:hypothetical protein
MKALHYLAALSLSLILGVAPFAVIAVNDAAAAKADVSTTVGTEGR